MQRTARSRRGHRSDPVRNGRRAALFDPSACSVFASSGDGALGLLRVARDDPFRDERLRWLGGGVERSPAVGVRGFERVIGVRAPVVGVRTPSVCIGFAAFDIGDRRETCFDRSNGRAGPSRPR